jgi:hypothetical protein
MPSCSLQQHQLPMVVGWVGDSSCIQCCCHQRMRAQMFLSARTALVVSAFDWLHDPFNLCTSRPKIDVRERRVLSTDSTSSCSLHLLPALGCPIPSHITLPASPTLATANSPQPPAIRLSIFSTFPLCERAPRVTGRDSMSSPNNVPSMVTCSALHCPDGFSAHLALNVSHSAWLSPC